MPWVTPTSEIMPTPTFERKFAYASDGVSDNDDEEQPSDAIPSYER